MLKVFEDKLYYAQMISAFISLWPILISTWQQYLSSLHCHMTVFETCISVNQYLPDISRVKQRFKVMLNETAPSPLSKHKCLLTFFFIHLFFMFIWLSFISVIQVLTLYWLLYECMNFSTICFYKNTFLLVVRNSVNCMTHLVIWCQHVAAHEGATHSI